MTNCLPQAARSCRHMSLLEKRWGTQSSCGSWEHTSGPKVRLLLAHRKQGYGDSLILTFFARAGSPRSKWQSVAQPGILVARHVWRTHTSPIQIEHRCTYSRALMSIQPVDTSYHRSIDCLQGQTMWRAIFDYVLVCRYLKRSMRLALHQRLMMVLHHCQHEGPRSQAIQHLFWIFSSQIHS